MNIAYLVCYVQIILCLCNICLGISFLHVCSGYLFWRLLSGHLRLYPAMWNSWFRFSRVTHLHCWPFGKSWFSSSFYSTMTNIEFFGGAPGQVIFPCKAATPGVDCWRYDFSFWFAYLSVLFAEKWFDYLYFWRNRNLGCWNYIKKTNIYSFMI
jgi:hypothetical protein